MGVAALSYDSVALLGDFATRRKITFPLLSDPDSAIIRRFGLLNSEYPEGDPAHGVPYPGTFVVDERGIIRAKFFEEAYANRRTAASMLVLEGAELPPGRETRTDFLTLRTSASNEVVFPGNRVTLVLDLDLKTGLHAYAPGAKGYRALDLRLEPEPLVTYQETVYPPSHPYVFKPLGETVQVFEGGFRLTRDIVFVGGKEMAPLLKSGQHEVTIRGHLDYQVCSDRICHPPATLPVSWTLKVRPLDTERPAEPLRHR